VLALSWHEGGSQIEQLVAAGWM